MAVQAQPHNPGPELQGLEPTLAAIVRADDDQFKTDISNIPDDQKDRVWAESILRAVLDAGQLVRK